MSRKKLDIAADNLVVLKKAAEKSFGKAVRRSFECELLSESIDQSIHEYISPQSLRRIWGFLKTPYSPAIRTLNVLSRFCGFVDWDDFTANIDKKGFTELGSKEETRLYLEFYKVDLHPEEDINYHNICRVIARRILSNPLLLSNLIRPLAEHPVSQVYFYERFPFIDGLASEYSKGIKLYLQKKTGEEAQVFGYCLLLLGSFLTENRRQLEIYQQKINAFKPEKTWHPFVIARYIGSHILYCHYTGNQGSMAYWIEQAKQYGKYFLNLSKIRFWKFPYYQFMICDYLNLAGEFQISLELIHPVRHITADDVLVEDGYFEAWKLIRDIPGIALRIDKGISTAIPPALHKLGFVFIKYFSLQLSTASFGASSGIKKREELRLEVERLVNHTGFTYFLRGLNLHRQQQ